METITMTTGNIMTKLLTWQIHRRGSASAILSSLYLFFGIVLAFPGTAMGGGPMYVLLGETVVGIAMMTVGFVGVLSPFVYRQKTEVVSLAGFVGMSIVLTLSHLWGFLAFVTGTLAHAPGNGGLSDIFMAIIWTELGILALIISSWPECYLEEGKT